MDLSSVLQWDERSLAEADIAQLNLECASGLPGSEGLDIEAMLRTLDEWAARVKFDTDRHLYQFNRNPAEYENSEAYYRMLMLTTVIQQDCGVRYNMERAREPDFRDARDLFIHGLLGEKRTGTCASMPVLTVAIGRRLGYPVSLAHAHSHVYVRWDLGDGDGKHMNFDATSLGLTTYDDEYYANWPEPLSQREVASGTFLRSLTRQEELAGFLQARGHCLEDNGRLAEAQVAYALANQLFPSHPYGLSFLAGAVDRQLGRSATFASGPPRPPVRRTIEDLTNMADEINARNAEILARKWNHSQHPGAPWPAATNIPRGSP